MTTKRGPGFLRAAVIVVACAATVIAGCTTSPKSGRPVADADSVRTTDGAANDDDDEGTGDDERPGDAQVGDPEPVARPVATAESGGDECAELQVIPCVLQVAEIDVPILGLDRFLHYRSDRVPGRAVAPQADIRGVSIGGFTLGEHHVYIPDAEVLLSGDGTRRSVAAVAEDGALFIASSDGRELYEFDEDGRHLRTRNATTGDETRLFDYDGDGLLAAIRTPGEPELTVDRQGDAVTLGLDGTAIMHLTLADGMLTDVVSPLDGKVYRFGYGEGGLLTSMTDPLGARTTYRYDADGRLITGETEGGRIDFTREGQEVTVSADDRLQGTLSIPEDPAEPWVWTGESGDVVRETVDESGDRSLDFGDGLTVEVTAADHPLFGAQARYAATTVITRPGESTVTEHRTITAEGPLTAPTEVRRTVDSGAGDTVTVWDAASRTVSSTTPGGHTTHVQLDDIGRIQGTGGFGVSEMLIERGTDNYPTAVTVDGVAGELAWADGGVTTSLGGAEQVMNVGRDGSVTSVTDALGRTMSRETVGTIVTTALNGETLSVGVGDGHHMTWSFPAGGITHTTATADDGTTITSGWDGGRTVTTELDEGLPVRTESGDAVTTFDYDDAGGALRSITRGDVAVGVAESGLGGTWSGLVEKPLDIAYETGDSGLASGITIGGTTYEVRYDPDGLLARMGPISLERSTDRALVTEQTVGNVVLRRDYDDSARPSGTSVVVGDETVAEVTLRRDDTHRLLAVDMTVGDRDENASYDYDAAGRLLTAERGDHRWAYTWDERDNLLEIATDGKTRKIAVDSANRITRADGMTYSYNKDHALATRSDGLAIATTPTGSVQQVTLPGGAVVEYILDGMNRRVGRLLDGEVTDYFTYHDALRPAARYTADGELVAAYFYDHNGALAAITKPDGTYAVVTDSVGSPVLVIDADTGTVEQQITYDPFGAIIADTNPGFQPFGFVGALADPDTGLVNIGAREYDPALGRFLSADPTLADGSPINLYAYGQGNPVEVVDRNGRRAVIYEGPPGPTRAQMDEFNAMMEDFLDAVAAAGAAGLAGASAAAGGFSGWADITDLARRLDLDTSRAGFMASWGKYSPAELVSELKRIKMLRNAALAADLFPVLDVLIGAYGVYSAHQDILRYGPSNLRAANLAAALLGLISGILGVLALVGFGLLAPELLLVLGMATALLSFCLMIKLCASIFGDPHIRTADGARFDYQGVGEFWALRSEDGGFDVQLRQEAYTEHVSVVTAAAVRLGDDVVEFYGTDRRVVVNGSDVEIAVGADHGFDGGTVTRVDHATYRVVSAAKDAGIEARVGDSLDVTVGIGDSLAGHVSGLYGNVDGDPENDWALPDGTVVDMAGDGAFERLHRTVGPAWRVEGTDMLLDGPSVWDAEFPPTAKTADDLPAADRAWAEAVCRAAGVTIEPFLADCVLDVVLTGDITFAASAARAAGIVQQTPTRADLTFAEAATAHTTVIYDARMTDFPVQDDGAGHALVIVDGEEGSEVVAIETNPRDAATGSTDNDVAWRHPTDGHCGVAVGGGGGSTWVAIPTYSGTGDGDGTRVIHLVDADSGTVSQTITLDHDRGPVCDSIAATGSALVVRTSADGMQLTGYDADSAESTFVIDMSGDVYGPVTAGDRSVWVATDDGDEITAGRVDLSDGGLTQTVTLPGEAFAATPVATADGFVASISGADGQAIVRVGADGVRWARAFPVRFDDKGYGAPSRLAVDGDVVAGYSTSSFLVVLDARTGDPVGMLTPTSFNNNGGHVTVHDGDITVGTFGGKHWVEGHDPVDRSLAFGFAVPEGPTLSDVKRLDSLGARGLVVQSAVEGLDEGRRGTAVTIFR